METLKVKSMLLGLLTLLTVSIMTSCQQDAIEDLQPTTLENTTTDVDERFVSLAPQILKKWWNSYEDETPLGNVKVYRPDSYTFPASRGRTGFEFLANGTFVYHYPGPTDVRMTLNGTWRQFGNSRILVRLFDGSSPFGRIYIIKVVSVDNNTLVIEPINIQV